MASVFTDTGDTGELNKSRLYGGVFGLKKAYKRTTDNDYQNTYSFGSKKSIRLYSDNSYMCGGYRSATQSRFDETTKLVSTFSRIDHSSDTINDIGNLLGTSFYNAYPSPSPFGQFSTVSFTGMGDHHGISDYTKAYFLGGVYYGRKEGRQLKSDASNIWGLGVALEFSSETISNDASLSSIFLRRYKDGGQSVFTSRVVNRAYFTGGREGVDILGIVPPGYNRDWNSGNSFIQESPIANPGGDSFDFDTSSWSSFPYAYSRTGSVSVSDEAAQYGYITGGVGGFGSRASISSSIFRLDFSTSTSERSGTSTAVASMDGQEIVNESSGDAYFYAGSNVEFHPPFSPNYAFYGRPNIENLRHPGALYRLNNTKFDFSSSTGSTLPSTDAIRRSSRNRGSRYGGFVGGAQAGGEYYQLRDFYRIVDTYTGSIFLISFSKIGTNSFGMAHVNQDIKNININRDVKGYFAGGLLQPVAYPSFTTSEPSSSIYRLDYATENITLTSSFPSFRSEQTLISSTSSRDLAYLSYVVSTKSDLARFTFDGEYIKSTQGNLIKGASFKKGTTKNSFYGYFTGDSRSVSSLYRIEFASDTSKQTDSNTTVRRDVGGIQTIINLGYFFGQSSGPSPNDLRIEKMDLSSETVSQISYPMIIKRDFYINTADNSQYGYIFDGNVRSLERFDPFSESSSLFSNVFSNFVYYGSVTSGDENYAYVHPGAYSSVIERLNYSDTTASIPGTTNLPERTAQGGGFTNVP